MLKKYETTPSTEVKSAPRLSTIQAILSYSKSLEVKQTKKDRLVICLN